MKISNLDDVSIKHYGDWILKLPPDSDLLFFGMSLDEDSTPYENGDEGNEDVGCIKFPNGWTIDVGCYGRFISNDLAFDNYYTVTIFPPGVRWGTIGICERVMYDECFKTVKDVRDKIIEVGNR
jgi:hypothetical protein